MKYCENWERIRERHAAYWRGERLGPCLFAVTAPADGAAYEDFPFPDDPEVRKAWWTDGEAILRRNRSWFASTYYAGDAFPILVHDLGPAGHAGFFEGAKPRFEGSIWYEPSLESYSDLRFDPGSFLYRKTVDLARYYAQEACGDFVVSMADTVGDADVLAHLRGPEDFLIDMMDDPDGVREALKAVQSVWERVMGEVADAVMGNNDGGTSVGWLGTWAPGRLGQLQCDLSVMLSPGMFGELLLYELNAQSGFLDHSLYHLDGEAQVRHLRHILSVPHIRAVQWTNVAGQAPVTAYIQVLQRIQKAGKSLILDCAPGEVPVLMEHLESSRLYIRTWAENRGEADDLVKLVARLTHD